MKEIGLRLLDNNFVSGSLYTQNLKHDLT